MKRPKAILIGVLIAATALPIYAATVTPGSDSTGIDYGPATLESDFQLKQSQGRPTVTVYPAGTTSSARGGDTVSLTSTDFCTSGANAIVCTGTDGKVDPSIVPSADDATLSTLPPLSLSSTGTITETVTTTDTSTVTNTATYTGTETGSVTAYDADTITITGTATGQSAALLDPTVTATVTGSGTRTNTWTRTLTVSVVAVGTRSATASTTALSYALYQPADTFSASATNTWSSSFTGSGTGTSTTTRTGSGTVTSTLSATSSTATGSGSGTIAGPADYTGTYTYTMSTTGTGVTTATYTFSVSNTGTGTGTGTATLTVVSATASTTASGTATAALTSTHTENATLTVTNTSSTTSTSTSTSTATQTTTGTSTNAATGLVADGLTISGGGSTYTLPIAGTTTGTGTSTATLGGIKVGSGLTRSADGTVSISPVVAPDVPGGDRWLVGGVDSESPDDVALYPSVGIGYDKVAYPTPSTPMSMTIGYGSTSNAFIVYGRGSPPAARWVSAGTVRTYFFAKTTSAAQLKFFWKICDWSIGSAETMVIPTITVDISGSSWTEYEAVGSLPDGVAIPYGKTLCLSVAAYTASGTPTVELATNSAHLFRMNGPWILPQ